MYLRAKISNRWQAHLKQGVYGDILVLYNIMGKKQSLSKKLIPGSDGNHVSKKGPRF